MTTASEWTGRVGDSWAETWLATDRSFGPVTTSLLEHPAIASFSSALDVGCGAGELACQLARARPGATVTGIDISASLLAVADHRCPDATFVEADAAHFVPGSPPDLLISRHGVMFFAAPVDAFAHLQSIAARNAVLRFSCFRRREENEWARRLSSIVPQPMAQPDPDAPGPFAFGDRNRVEAILCAAGWSDIEFESLDYAMLAGEGEDALDQAYAYFQKIGPAARALSELQGPDRAHARTRLRTLLEDNCTNSQVTLPAAAWIVTARAPG